MYQLKLKTAAIIVSATAFFVAACVGSAAPTIPASESLASGGGMNISESAVSSANIQEGAESGTGINAATGGIAESNAAAANSGNPNGANIVAVSVSGDPGNYSISVTVESPDTGCNSYADWWEAISEDGELPTRRILLHSHVGEQPFTRSGGPLRIQPDETVIVRAHMSDAGYGGSIMRGNVTGGFATSEIAPDFASNLETRSPLPSSCAF